MDQIDEAEPRPLTPAHVAALEEAIRAQGYRILVDTEAGLVRLTGGHCKGAVIKIRAAAHADKVAGGAFRINAVSWSEIEQMCDEALEAIGESGTVLEHAAPV